MNSSRFVNRLQGDMPKIGIRPIIDGRRGGIRESLEEPTMNMAIACAKFFERKFASFERAAGRMRHCRYDDWRRSGSGESSREIPQGRRRRYDLGDAVLVLPA